MGSVLAIRPYDVGYLGIGLGKITYNLGLPKDLDGELDLKMQGTYYSLIIGATEKLSRKQFLGVFLEYAVGKLTSDQNASDRMLDQVSIVCFYGFNGYINYSIKNSIFEKFLN
jgi:hypothetical protein